MVRLVRILTNLIRRWIPFGNKKTIPRIYRVIAKNKKGKVVLVRVFRSKKEAKMYEQIISGNKHLEIVKAR